MLVHGEYKIETSHVSHSEGTGQPLGIRVVKGNGLAPLSR